MAIHRTCYKGKAGEALDLAASCVTILCRQELVGKLRVDAKVYAI